MRAEAPSVEDCAGVPTLRNDLVQLCVPVWRQDNLAEIKYRHQKAGVARQMRHRDLAGRGSDLKMIHREEHSVVLTPIEFTGFTQPVIPLMPGESRPVGFILSAPQEVQQKASPYVTISTIALADPAFFARAASHVIPSPRGAPVANASDAPSVSGPAPAAINTGATARPNS